MQKNKLNKILSMVIAIAFILSSSGAAFGAEELQVDKTAEKINCTHVSVNIQVNGSGQTTINPADVVLAIDASGSMQQNDPTGLRKTSANNFIDKLNSTTDKVGVVNWDDAIRQQQNLTNNFTQAQNVVNQNTPGGFTNGALALETSIGMLDADSVLEPYQKFIILLTDGEFNRPTTGTANSAALAQADIAAEKGYKIFTIGLGSGVDPLILGQIADKTGGSYYFAASATALDSIYDEIFQAITQVASNITVTDVIPDYMTFGSPTIDPTTNTLNPDDTTTLTWFIPKLGHGESWNVSYILEIDPDKKFGENVQTNVEAFVNYTDPSGNPGSTDLPVPTENFYYSSIGDFVWNDLNGNGIYDPGEPGIENVLVELFKEGISQGTTLTNASGNYLFSELTPGNFHVKFYLPTGYIFTLQDQGVGDEIDSSADPETGLTTPFFFPCDTMAILDAGMRAYTDLAVVKEVDKAAQYVGQNLVYTINAMNNGPSNATGVIVTDLLPAGLQFISANSSVGNYDPGTGIWTIGDLSIGQLVSLTINALVTVSNTSIENTAVVSGNELDPIPENNTSTVITDIDPAADLNIVKLADKSVVNVEDLVTYIISVTNNGPDTAINVQVTDILPTGFSYISSNASTGSYDPATGIWTIGDLLYEQVENLIMVVQAVQVGTFENVAVVESDTYDPNPDDNTSSVVVEVEEPVVPVDPVEPEVKADTVPMQDTGAPFALLVLALLAVLGGLTFGKRK